VREVDLVVGFFQRGFARRAILEVGVPMRVSTLSGVVIDGGIAAGV
jgi:hypothetical protein